MKMYMKDKTEIIKIRVSQEQHEFLMRMSVAWGVSKSQAMRTIIDSYRCNVSRETEGEDNEDK